MRRQREESCEQPPVDYLTTLPIEALNGVFAVLDFPEVGRISRVCKSLNQLNNSLSLWQEREREVRRRCEWLFTQQLLPTSFDLSSIWRIDIATQVTKIRLGMLFSSIASCCIYYDVIVY
jgi:hypothetical protein